ncbi:178_t:CDS:10 [Ambispora leptoticha]|uniref:178_t:CDS:1 n=1 Tax=Ambispora leptoticha TaxID=144679 RepID=A0A9N9BXN9_9GLOM|nr:178_t:CDS:10 [Ambispora leptoticha]
MSHNNRSTPRFSRGSSRKARKHMLGRNVPSAFPVHEFATSDNQFQPEGGNSNIMQPKYFVREIVDVVKNEEGNWDVLANFKGIESMWLPFKHVHNGEKLLENYKKKNLTIPSPTSSAANINLTHPSTSTLPTPQIPPQWQRECISKSNKNIIPSESLQITQPMHKNVSLGDKTKGKQKQFSEYPIVLETNKEVEESIQINILSNSPQRKIGENSMTENKNNEQAHCRKVKKGVRFSGQVERQSPPPWIFGMEIPEELEQAQNSITTPKSILKGSEEISYIKQELKTESSKILLEWKGLLILQNDEPIQKQIVIRPLRGHCPDPSILKESMPRNELILDNLLSFFYAMKLMEKMNPLSIFVMQPATQNEHFTEVWKAFNNYKLTKKIGIIYLSEDESLCFFVFPNIDNEYKIFGLPKRPPNAMSLLIPFTISIPKPTNNPNMGNLSFHQSLNVDSYYAQVAIVANKWQGLLPEICKAYPKFAVFGVKGAAEVTDLIDALRFYDAVYAPDFEDENIKIVFVQFDIINQLCLIPNLSKLKKRCEFRIFGYIPHLSISVNLKPILVAGGYVIFTSLVIKSNENLVDRILKQKEKLNGTSTWKLVLHPKTAKILNSVPLESSSRKFRFNKNMIDLKLSDGKIEMLKHEEIFTDGNEAHYLYWSLIRLQALYFHKFCHFVFIGEESEIPVTNSHIIGGVEQCTLEQFEDF